MLNFSRYKTVGPWFAEAKYFWLALAVNLLALVACLQAGTAEPKIRLTGLLLQLLGIGTVIWGICETRAFFDHLPVSEKAKNWLRRFPLLRRDGVASGGACVLAVSAVGGRGFGTFGPGLNPTIESRLDAAEKNIAAIHELITANQREMDAGYQKLTDTLDHEQETRKIENAALESRLDAASTGGVHISAIGASWLFVGVVLSTAAPELAGCLK
jgi:hypothetical protein